MTLFDVINPIKEKLKQFFCNHDYALFSRDCGFTTIYFAECKKCGRTRVLQKYNTEDQRNGNAAVLKTVDLWVLWVKILHLPPDADGKQNKHCAIKLNANVRLG